MCINDGCIFLIVWYLLLIGNWKFDIDNLFKYFQGVLQILIISPCFIIFLVVYSKEK